MHRIPSDEPLFSPLPCPVEHVCRKSNRLMMHLAHEICQCSHAGSLTAANLRAHRYSTRHTHTHTPAAHGLSKSRWILSAAEYLCTCALQHLNIHRSTDLPIQHSPRLYLHAHLVILTVCHTHTASRIRNQKSTPIQPHISY